MTYFGANSLKTTGIYIRLHEFTRLQISAKLKYSDIFQAVYNSTLFKLYFSKKVAPVTLYNIYQYHESHTNNCEN